MWTDKRVQRLSGFSPRDFAEWFAAGIRDWTFDNKRYRNQAFSPVADAFDPLDDPEYQVSVMFKALPGELQKRFLAGLAIVFHEAPGNEAGYELFRAAQICLEYLDRPGAAVAMIDRLVQPGFLDHAPGEWREELFALSIVLLRKMFRMSDLRYQIARLRCRSDLFLDDFIPAIVGMVLDREPSALAEIVGAVAPWRLPDVAIQAESLEAVTSRVSRWPWMQVEEALDHPGFADLIRPYNGDDAEARYEFVRHCLSARVTAATDVMAGLAARDIDLATFMFDCQLLRYAETNKQRNAEVAIRICGEWNSATAVERDA